MNRKHPHSFRAHFRLFHQRHGHALRHAGRAGIFGELAYHGAEALGAHQVIGSLAGVLVVCTLARLAAGDIFHE